MSGVGPGDQRGWAPYLGPGETLLWHGAPAPGLHVRPLTVALSLTGLGFLAMGLLGVASGLREAILADGGHGRAFGTVFALFALPFAVTGAALLVGPWYAAWKASEKVRYALTDRNAYIARSWWGHSVESHPLHASGPLELERGRVDTVWFNTVRGVDSEGSPTLERFGFRDIANGPEVHALLKRLLETRT